MKKRLLFFSSPGFLLFVAVALLWLPWLGSTPFFTKGEPREAIVAVSILQSGDWILPANFGSDIPYKPPFLAWCIAFIAWAFNGGEVNEYISRLPSALAAIAMIMGGYVWASKAQGQRFAVIMALVTATSVEVFRAAEACRVDMILTAAMVGALYLLYETRERRGLDNVGWYASAAALLTIATLTKGPVGALLPCLCFGIYRLLRGDNALRTIGSLSLLAVVSFILPALWYYAAWKRGGDTFIDLAFEENIGRLTGHMSYSSHEKPVWYVFTSILAGMCPWTLLALLGLFRLKAFHHWPFKPSGLLAMVTACTVVIFYCIPASKRSVYLLPAYPFMAYGITVLIESFGREAPIRFFGRVMAFLGIATPLLLAFVSLIHNPFVHDVHIRGFIGWILLAVCVALSVWWYMGRSKSPVAMPTIWALFLCYSGAVMPALFGSPLRVADTEARFETLKSTPGTIYAMKHPSEGGSAYWMNYYLGGDRMRSLPDASAANALPRASDATFIYFPNPDDTVGLDRSWRIERFGYNPDTRRDAFIASRP